MLFIISLKSFLRPPSSSVSAMLNACRVSPGHEVRPWSYHTVDSVYSLRGKAGNHFRPDTNTGNESTIPGCALYLVLFVHTATRMFNYAA